MTRCDFGASKEECGCRDCRDTEDFKPLTDKEKLEKAQREIKQLTDELIQTQRELIKEKERNRIITLRYDTLRRIREN